MAALAATTPVVAGERTSSEGITVTFNGTEMSPAAAVTLPFVGTSAYNGYGCLVNFVVPETSNTTYYAFETTPTTNDDGSVTVEVSHVAIAVIVQDGSYQLFEGSYVSGVLAVDFLAYNSTSTGGNPFAMRAVYSGDDSAHSFTYKSTLRGPLTNCTPTATDADDEAKKLWGSGVSQGSGAGFLMRLGRECDVAASPEYFCVGAATKEQTIDTAICETYSDAVDAGTLDSSLMDAASVPFTDTIDTDNWAITR